MLVFVLALLAQWQGAKPVPIPAPFETFVGSFVQPKTTGDFSITGVGFKPKVVILYYAGNVGAGAWEGTGTAADKTGLGMAVMIQAPAPSPGVGAVVLNEAVDDAGTDASVYQALSSNTGGPGAYSLVARSGSTVVLGAADLVSLDADGFTLNFTVADGADHLIDFVALGGASLRANLIEWTMPLTAGTVEKVVTGVGFQADLVLHLFGSNLLTGGSLTTRADFNIGAMDRARHQWSMGFDRPSTAGPGASAAVRYTSDARALYAHHNPAINPPNVDAELLEMTQDGWRMLFYANPSSPARVVSLALSGIEARVGVIDKPLGAGTVDTTGLGFQPQALMLATAMGANGATQGGNLGAGFGTTSSGFFSITQGSIARMSSDNVTPFHEKKRTDPAILFGPTDATTNYAELAGFLADGFSLAWSTTGSVTWKVGYIALGRRVSASPHMFEAELAGVDNGWTDITRDVLLQEAVSLKYGITGTGPLDLCASTGLLDFTLDNSEDNSAGLVGYYSPRHPFCRPGFTKGIRIRYTYLIPNTSDGYGKFVGRLREIQPEPGKYRDRKTACLAADWMNEAAITKFSAATQVAKRVDQILGVVVPLVPRQPDSTSYDTGDSTFPYAMDNGLTERSTVLTELQRLAQSEYGRIYLRGGLNYWGQLRFEKRTARLAPVPVITFAGTMQKLDAADSTSKVKNKSKVTAHPRRVDAAATTVLFSKPNQNNPAVAPGQAIRITGRYVDPANPNARIGGTDMVAPVATTDYLMNAAADGSGSNLTAFFTVGAAYGANQVVYTITNGGLTTGYVTKLQARGRGLYDYDPLEATEENADSIDLLGESSVELDMPYQSEYTVAQAIAEYLVATWGSHESSGPTTTGTTPGVAEISLERVPRTAEELTELMAIEPGMPAVVSEELAVLNDVYYVQNVDIKITGDKTTFAFDLQRALVQSYWALGTAGLSELGTTTVLAPL